MFVSRVLAIAFLQLYFVEEISGQLPVTMGIFSGRKDPEWVIPGTHPKMVKIQLLLVAAEKAKTFHPKKKMPPRLGYKGFIVVYKNAKRLILGPKTVDLQEALFATRPAGTIPDTIVAEILKTIKAGTVLPMKPVRRKRYAPPFNPAPYMFDDVREDNNCYNYANIRITDTYAQPGRGAGALFIALTGAAVQAGAIADGLAVVANGNFPVGPRHVVALVIWPGVDFHFFLRDNDGHWSHKPGETSVTRTDNSGNLINDPSAAGVDMNGYVFHCFMTTNRNTVNIL